MPGQHSFAEVSYTLTDLLVCAYNATTDAFSGVPSSLADGQTLKIEPEADSDELRGYGSKTRILRVAVGAKLTLGSGGIHIASYVIMTGSTTQTSGSAPSRVRTVDDLGGGSGLPYFGVIGVAATDDGGYMVAGLKGCKLDNHPAATLDGSSNKFNLSEASGYAIVVNGKLARRKFYETLTDWTAPATSTAFGAFFTAP